MEARRAIIHQSLHRQNLVLGAERELTMLSAMLALLVGIGGMTVISGVSATVFWICAIFLLRRMARHDPQLSQVWRRHIRLQDYYPARSSRWRKTEGFKVKA